MPRLSKNCVPFRSAGTALLSVSGSPMPRGITIDTASQTPRVLDSWGDNGDLREDLRSAELGEIQENSNLHSTSLFCSIDLAFGALAVPFKSFAICFSPCLLRKATLLTSYITGPERCSTVYLLSLLCVCVPVTEQRLTLLAAPLQIYSALLYSSTFSLLPSSVNQGVRERPRPSNYRERH